MSEALDILAGDVALTEGEQPDGIAGSHPHDHEGDDRDADQGGDRVDQPTQDEVAQALLRLVGRPCGRPHRLRVTGRYIRVTS